MPYEKVKVYFDGSHYIAIPQNEGKSPGKGGYHGNENDEMRTAFEKAYKNNIGENDYEALQKAKDLAARFTKNFVKYTGNEAGKALVKAGPQL